MKRVSSLGGSCLVLSGALVLALGSCLGPNPGFFIGTSAANATITTIVSTVLGTVLNNMFGLGGP